MKEYIPPTFGSNLFTCPICGGNGQQAFLEPFTATESLSISHRVRHQIPYQLSQCKLCHGYAIWSNGTLIYPTTLIPPPPSEDMPSQTREDYEEARKVYSASAKASAAFLRLAIQRFCQEQFGLPGKDLNKDIGELVKKGMPPRVQQALDTVRVIGNESVHPGTIDVNDNPEIAMALFNLVNMIVYETITKDKELDALYSTLPADKLSGIASRDKTSTP